MNIPLIKSFIPYLVASLGQIFIRGLIGTKNMTTFKSLDSSCQKIRKEVSEGFILHRNVFWYSLKTLLLYKINFNTLNSPECPLNDI